MNSRLNSVISFSLLLVFILMGGCSNSDSDMNSQEPGVFSPGVVSDLTKIDSPSVLLWAEDFESVPCGQLPPGWASGCGNNDMGVDCANSCEGDRSLRMFGRLGSCWAALAAVRVDPSAVYVPQFHVSLKVVNGTETLTGCHPQRASLEMKGGQCWNSQSRSLFVIHPDGSIFGTTGTVIGMIENTAECHEMEVEYNRLDSSTLRVSYWLDGVFLSAVTTGTAVFESNLIWFHFGAQEGTAWFDDIVVCSGPRPSPVTIDIKPGSCPNPLNPGSNGVLPVAILGSESLDVDHIDLSSVRLEGISPWRGQIEDVSSPPTGSGECDCSEAGPDGFVDLTLKFKTQDIVEILGILNSGESYLLTITGNFLDGSSFEASDCVVIVGNPNEDGAKTKVLTIE